VTEAVLPDLLRLDVVGDHRFRVHHPDSDPEGRDVVFGGQLLAQMIMASSETGGGKEVKSIHALFARTGTYSAPIELAVESIHAGRSWASDTVTAWQGERLLSRGLVLLNNDEPDIIRHELEMPKVPGPEAATAGEGLGFPGAELRTVEDPTATTGGVAALHFWTRFEHPVPGVAANQAILSWNTNGFMIGLAVRDHRDVVKIEDAHRTVSTGVIGHTINFHERFDVSEWLLLTHESTYAGRGRVHSRGLVYREDGQLVATFTQDSMVRGVDGPIDPKRAM
jgi:acyl-CoA thioesterase II